VQVDDVEDENLLGEFSRTGKFIEEGLQSGGGVLVHW
jgi:dual specificity phosphatase 12